MTSQWDNPITPRRLEDRNRSDGTVIQHQLRYCEPIILPGGGLGWRCGQCFEYVDRFGCGPHSGGCSCMTDDEWMEEGRLVMQDQKDISDNRFHNTKGIQVNDSKQ